MAIHGRIIKTGERELINPTPNCTVYNTVHRDYRQNQISAMLTDSQWVKGEVPGYPPPPN